MNKRTPFVFILSIVLCLSLLPGAVLAEGDGGTGAAEPAAIQLGVDALLNPTKVETSDGYYYAPRSYVFFGLFDSPIQWRVLDAEKANDDKTEGIFLLSEDTLLGTPFNREYHEAGSTYHKGPAPSDGDHSACIPANRYQGSDAQKWCRDFVTGNSYNTQNFSDVERSAMLGIEKKDAAPNGLLYDLSWGASELTTDDKLFFLSIREFYDHMGTAESVPGIEAASGDVWWLRSPRAELQRACRVGCVYVGVRTWEVDQTRNFMDGRKNMAARPAFNLNKDAVLMISDISSPKFNGKEGELTAVGTCYDARYWTLTLKDRSRNGFKAETTAVNGNTLTVSYQNAATGENEYLSAYVKDEKDNVKYYGRILRLDNDSAANGEAVITLPKGFDRVKDTLCVFSEECHRKGYTDYASEPVEVKLPEYAITADAASLDFGSLPSGFTAMPAAKIVTVTNVGKKEITVNLPTSSNYTVTADRGFTGNTATLAPDGAAAFTVRPRAGLTEGTYAETLTVATNEASARCTIELSFVFGSTQVSDYAQITLVNNMDWGDGTGYQMLLDADADTYARFIPESGALETNGDASDGVYAHFEYKLPENANGKRDTKNIVSCGSSASILIPAGIYDYCITNPTPNESVYIPRDGTALGRGDDYKFEAGKHYIFTVSQGTHPTEPGVMADRVDLEVQSIFYTVNLNGNGGTVNGSGSFRENTEITVTAVPDKGYSFVRWEENGKEVSTNESYTFTVTANRTLTAVFEKQVCFVDVPSNAYYYDAVFWAAWNGITNGTDATHFSPNDACTRAQVVTFLWRAAGNPAGDSTMKFSDVDANAYYAEAVRWAVSLGITKGTGETTFSPDATCTRAQIVTFLFRYADPDASAPQDSISGFADAGTVPDYALPAMNWAFTAGILKGDGENIMPNNACTRGQIVTFLYRALVE